jgi:hypothetical protein
MNTPTTDQPTDTQILHWFAENEVEVKYIFKVHEDDCWIVEMTDRKHFARRQRKSKFVGFRECAISIMWASVRAMEMAAEEHLAKP